mmetsp:Transcript_14223/g.40493  ORF Transcript_14223/g.40493 Transcript_14223/m.40493 type:complete len:89 (-) Transcript_14223:3-269(-)
MSRLCEMVAMTTDGFQCRNQEISSAVDSMPLPPSPPSRTSIQRHDDRQAARRSLTARDAIALALPLLSLFRSFGHPPKHARTILTGFF